MSVYLNSRRVRKTVFTRHFLALALLVSGLVVAGSYRPSNRIQPTAQAVSTSIVISQVYGGGGNAGATLTNDFIELHNVSGSPVSVAGWSVQYASATGTTWAVTNLTGSIAAGGYYLVQEAQGAGGTTPLPTPEAIGTIAMSGTAGKVALTNTTTALTGACPTGGALVDFVGYGPTANCSETAPTAILSNTTAAIRAGSGCTDTDHNDTDFAVAAPTPRNGATPVFTCGGGGTPTLNINDVALAEGNAGTTTFTFTVSLTAAAAGNVTFDIATADGTATVGNNDYVARSLTNQTITTGNTNYSFDVTVNGDVTPEPNETFFVNVTNVVGANAGDVQGLGTINNDEIVITPIHDIQGNGSTSPMVTQVVTTGGIVTATKNNGFFIQAPDANADADPNTSEGIFVFTSSAPPAAAAIGNSVAVTATVQEFIPAAAPHQPPVTELGTVTATTLLSSGNTLPTPITITAADTNPNNLENLEKFEGMRVHVNSLIVCGPTGGTITEPSATVASSGLFFGVLPGVPRPFREAGVDASLDLPVGAPVTVPRFDTNPERLRIDSDVQPGTTAIDVAAGTTVSNITGPLDYAFVTWTIYPDAATPPVVGTQPTPQPIPAQNANELTVASFNMERFFDTTDDPNTSDPILTAGAFNGRLAKASLIIRTVQRMPDVIGVEEMENLTTLQAVATKVNNDAVAASQPNPNYQAFLNEGNDVGGIDVGFLVKTSHVSVVDVTQLGLSTTYINPNNGMPELLNDRPTLQLRATIPNPAGGAPLPFTVLVNHLRSLSGVDDPTDGNRIRTKRREQALALANVIQTRQTNDPNEVIITVGDMNAFQVNDGYVDSIGIIKGTPAPASQVTLFGADVVNPDLVDLVDTLPLSERYSYTFDGNAQVLDHILLNQAAMRRLNRFHYARFDADYPVKHYQDSARVERLSDHDSPVAYFTLGSRINKPGDFDGDGRTDFSVFRNASGDWYSLSSLSGSSTGAHFGANGDKIVPGDYDGDGRTDLAVFRGGVWYILKSGTSTLQVEALGAAADTPVPADYDGDGKTDVAVFSSGTWSFIRSSNHTTGSVNWGGAASVPVVGNFDGDNKADFAYFQNGTWQIQSATGVQSTYFFGLNGDTPVAGDYDSDGRTDVAVFRAGNWYILNSSDNSVRTVSWGLASDVVVPGNYDDDNRTDVAVYRGGTWYVLSSYTNSLVSAGFGTASDTPVPR
jgi:predicted extracellular nuclease